MRIAIAAIAFSTAMLTAAPASAALPPNYQRLAELRAVLALPEVGRAFGLEPIDRIEYVARDLYRLSAGRCHLDVRIVDLPTTQRRRRPPLRGQARAAGLPAIMRPAQSLGSCQRTVARSRSATATPRGLRAGV